MNEVSIVGAGMAGLVLAREIASHGIRCTVYETRGRVGEGANKASGILSIEGLQTIGISYKEAMVNTLDGAVIYGGGKRLRIKADKPKAYVLDRELLAQACAKDAREAGAEIVLNARLGKEKLQEMARENIVVGADGAVSTVASVFGFPEVRDYILTYKAEYRGAKIEDSHSVELFFAGAAKKFFGWNVPYSKSVLEVGIGEWMRSKRNSRTVFQSFIKNDKIADEISGAEMLAGRASMIPLAVRKETVRGNVLLVGDAAGQVKATTGGGIIFGALCAKEAAAAILAHVSRGTPLYAYESMWRRKYGGELKLHRLIHAYYSMLGSRGFGAMLSMWQLLGVDRFLSEYGDMDRPSLVMKRMFVRR